MTIERDRGLFSTGARNAFGMQDRAPNDACYRHGTRWVAGWVESGTGWVIRRDGRVRQYDEMMF